MTVDTDRTDTDRTGGDRTGGDRTGGDRTGGDLGFPLLGRALVAISLVANVMSAVALDRSWANYRSAWAVLLAWGLTVSAVPLAVRRILRARRMTASTVAGLAAVVLGCDLVVPSLLDPALRATPAAWNWRSGAVLICVLSVYRRPRDVALLAIAHAGVAAVIAAAAGVITPTAGVVLVLVCAAPSLAATNYLAVYTAGLRSRQVAVELHLQTSTSRATEAAQRQSVLDEVASIRRRMIALLEAVGAGDRDPADVDVRREAGELSSALRRELDETRSRGWLVGTTGPPVDVLGPATRLDDGARASVAALVALLRRHESLTRVVVTIGDGDHDETDGGAAERDGVDVTVVASGIGSADAAADPAVLAAAEDLGTTVWHDAEAGHLVVEARVATPVDRGCSVPAPPRRVTD